MTFLTKTVMTGYRPGVMLTRITQERGGGEKQHKFQDFKGKTQYSEVSHRYPNPIVPKCY